MVLANPTNVPCLQSSQFQTLQKFHSQQKHFDPSKCFKCTICLQLPHLQRKLSYTRVILPNVPFAAKTCKRPSPPQRRLHTFQSF